MHIQGLKAMAAFTKDIYEIARDVTHTMGFTWTDPRTGVAYPPPKGKPQMESLTDAEIKKINEGHCPDCDHRGFVLGPRGGAAINIECGSVTCASRFNVACTSVSHHIVFGHRIKRRDNGGANWG